MGRFCSIFFNETFRLAYWDLLEWIKTLKSGIGVTFFPLDPLSWPIHHRRRPLSRPPTTLIIVATVSSIIDVGHCHSHPVVNMGHRCGHFCCQSRPLQWLFLLSMSAIVVAVAVVNVGHHCSRCCHCRWCRHLQSHCHCQRIVHIIVELIVTSIAFSSFNDVDMCYSMVADCCMPRCQGWGTMAAVGQQCLPWLAGACILLSLS